MNRKDINIISLKAFSYIFSELINGNQRFCFILGSGTSREAGILTGIQMTKIWISQLKDKYEEYEIKNLMEKFGVENLEATSENYFSIYDMRFYPEYRHGQAFLEQELEKGVPGLGHYILAKILTDGRNNIAITTNFDSLIEDAIIKYTGKKVILIGHESLSQFVNINISKPIVAKIHRGLYYNPLNRKEELNGLKEEWKEMLRQIFWVYTPIVIGYAGGDQSLMKFLKEDNLKLNGLYWCYWNKEEPTDEIKKLVNDKNGCLVPINGFEEMMFALSQKMGFDESIKLDNTIDNDLLAKYYYFCTNNGRGEEERNTTGLVTLFDIYGIKKVEELQIEKRWVQNEVFRSLTVPIGLGKRGECVELNIHEAAHGPHGLIAGTVGSGKSEFIQSYIISLAINFHPQEVGILLIDYKGGGIAHVFDGLPHILGTITNLDEEYIHFIASIRGELKRRQRILSEYNVNHINNYINLYKQGKAKEPLPYLVLICDEFSDIKREFPEFLKMLLDITRVGRSLGIHLILATQTPSGVVNDIIWSNCRFRICFKVKDEFESRDLLKTPDAAYIANIGQAYLQVGNNEIYECFQAAWGGVSCQEEIEKSQDKMEVETQLEAIKRHIIQVYDKGKALEVRKTWLPPLPLMMVPPYHKNIMNNTIEVLDMTLGIGMVDEPEEQTRQEYKLDFIKKGHILYMASEGYGKSIFLGNIIIGLAIKNSVKNLKFFIIDMGDYALLPFKKLAHVADYFSFRDIERIAELKKIIMDTIEERKRKFDEAMIEDFSLYNKTQKDKLEAIIIVVDNYERLIECGEGMMELLKTVALVGGTLGIYLAVTLSRIDAMKMSTLVNFTERIGGFNYRIEDIDCLIGHSHIRLVEEKKGRALIKLNNVKLMQLYTPVPCDDKNVYINALTDIIDEINATCTVYTNCKPIPTESK